MNRVLLERRILLGAPEDCRGCEAPRSLVVELAAEVISGSSSNTSERYQQEEQLVSDAQAIGWVSKFWRIVVVVLSGLTDGETASKLVVFENKTPMRS